MNMQSIEVETGTERPINPPKLFSAVCTVNPFDDVVPRAIAAPKPIDVEKRASKPASQQALPARGGAELLQKRKPEKNKNLLSFDDDGAGEDDGDAVIAVPSKGIVSSHDVLHDPKLAKTPAVRKEDIE